MHVFNAMTSMFLDACDVPQCVLSRSESHAAACYIVPVKCKREMACAVVGSSVRKHEGRIASMQATVR